MVTARDIHASPAYSFASIAAWVRYTLQQNLEEHAPWLIKDSFGLKKRLMQLRSCNGEAYARMDIKDFFLSGSKEELIEDALDNMDEETRPVMKRCLNFLLEEQWVRDAHGHDGSLCKATSGTGMGLLHSGELSDWIIRNNVEYDLPSLLQAQGMASTSD